MSQPTYNNNSERWQRVGYQQTQQQYQGYNQSYGQPGYGQPGYGQPGYGQPGFTHQPQPTTAWLNNDTFANGPSGKSRGLFALLALLLGTWGIQYFYIGKTTAGILTICIFCGLSLLSCFYATPFLGLLPLIQGIVVFCSNNQEFERKFVNTTDTFPLF